MIDQNEVTFDGLTYEAVVPKYVSSCVGCAFYDKNPEIYCISTPRGFKEREDKTNVIFIEKKKATPVAQEPVAVVGGQRRGWFYLEGRPDVKIGDKLYSTLPDTTEHPMQETVAKAIKKLHMLLLPAPNDGVIALDVCKAVSEQATEIIHLLEDTATVQEPVAYMHISGEDCVSHPDLERNPAWTCHYPIPLHTTPPDTTALLQQALDALERSTPNKQEDILPVARAIAALRKHLGEN